MDEYLQAVKNMSKKVFTALAIVGAVVASISLLFGLLGHGNEGQTSDFGHNGLWEICVTSGGYFDDNLNYVETSGKKCSSLDFNTADDDVEGKIKGARAFLILSHLVAVPMIASFVAILFIGPKKVEPKKLSIAALVTSVVYFFFLMLACSLATDAYNLDQPGVSAGWSLVLPWLGWVLSVFLIPLAGALFLGAKNQQAGPN